METPRGLVALDRLFVIMMIDAVDAASLIDHLSELFMSISDICQEQFSIIRQVDLFNYLGLIVSGFSDTIGQSCDKDVNLKNF